MIQAVGRRSLLRRSAYGIRSFASLGPTPPEFKTLVSNPSDKQRDAFFKYSWGTWLSNDLKEKSLRETRFSIQGLAALIKGLDGLPHIPKPLANGEPSTAGDHTVDRPIPLSDGLILVNTAQSVTGSPCLEIKSIESIHEGKHHRVFAITFSSHKKLVLRIPYSLCLPHATSSKVQSEAATLDFLHLKLGLSVPRVVAFGSNRDNALHTPYILMEYVSGDLLMKQWHPLAPTLQDDSALHNVIDTIAEFHAQTLAVEFTKSGSLYFFDHVLPQHQSAVPYLGEQNPALKDRWRIGPCISRSFARKNALLVSQIEQYSGPWNEDMPLQVVSALANLERENAQTRLAIAQSSGPANIAMVSCLTSQVETFDALSKISHSLLNPASLAIKNVQALFAPRLYLPDLDPLNVIVLEKGNVFVDMEFACIKPFALATYPAFVAYQGARVYDVHQDVDGYLEMDEAEQQQYQYMQCKTRNERLWETALNDRRHDLIAVASPHIKLLRSPYEQCLHIKNDMDYLFVKGALLQLESVWETYVANDLCLEHNHKLLFPNTNIAEFNQELAQYQADLASTPFSATGGWVPQDMFDALREQGLLTQQLNGDWKVETEKVLQ